MKMNNKGILELGTGKVGPVIGSSAQGTDYLRKYVVPKNPRTLAQMQVRFTLAVLGEIGKRLVEGYFKPFMNQYTTPKSSFSQWISDNFANIYDPVAVPDAPFVYDISNLEMNEGSLERASVTSASYNPANGEMAVGWDGTIQQNGKATDKIIIMIIKKTVTVNVEDEYPDGEEQEKYPLIDIDAISFIDSSATRQDVQIGLNIWLGLVPANLFCFVIAYQEGVDNLVAPASSMQVVSV